MFSSKLLFTTAIVKFLAMMLLLGGCSTTLLDIAEGQRAERQGDFTTAEKHFRGLAERGYPAAMIEYGDLLKSRGKVSDYEKAEYWYEKARQHRGKSAARANERLAKLYFDKVSDEEYVINAQEIQQTEHYHLENFAEDPFTSYVNLLNLYFHYWHRSEIPEEKIRALTQRMQRRGQYFASFSVAALNNVRYVNPEQTLEICEKLQFKVRQCHLEKVKAAKQIGLDKVSEETQKVVHQYTHGFLGETDLLAIGRELYRVAPFFPQQAEKILQLLYRTNEDYAYELAKLYYQSDLKNNADKVIELLDTAADNHDIRANYLLGRMYMEGEIVPVDPAKAVELLEKAKHQVTNAELLLGEIFYDGLLGRADPQKAFDYFLSAARRGVVNADYELAKMFWICEGNICNEAYAVSFITLARKKSNSEKIVELYEDIYGNTSEHVQQNGRNIVQEEERMRYGQYMATTK